MVGKSWKRGITLHGFTDKTRQIKAASREMAFCNNLYSRVSIETDSESSLVFSPFPFIWSLSLSVNFALTFNIEAVVWGRAQGVEVLAAL